ncbi:MAG: DNA repair protein RadC [Gammaproteobacteria bacterium]|nr:DNA repair protein RadC [Gammaproteobacteria bacterium]NNJ85481.1 DNA repair protein RadC [Gammaproteobacteria bacterium]
MPRKITDLPENDRPRERLISKGAAALSDQDLLAILLGRGARGVDVMTLAARLSRFIDEKGLDVRAEDLIGFDGVGIAKATLILAAIEFVRRRIKPEGVKIKTPADLVSHIRHYADRKQEHFLCASVNGANEVINIRVVSIGLVDRSLAHPREVFADPIADRAFAVILAHNHPMGPLRPSPADIEITRKLRKAGEIMGIAVLDHIIFNRTEHFSFLNEGVDF